MIRALIVWAFFGLIVGLIARIFVGGPRRIGCLGTIALGVLGSVVGGTIGQLAIHHSVSELHVGGFISSILGTMLVLLLLPKD
jgi:uncharacterized membrane protein YeaQ/YmgE (transglycosylase-associated protein family)